MTVTYGRKDKTKRVRALSPDACAEVTADYTKKLDDEVLYANQVLTGKRPYDGAPNSIKKVSSPRKIKKKQRRFTQMYIDLGQKSAERRRCKECGLLFMPGMLEDERMHEKVHRKKENIDTSNIQVFAKRFYKYIERDYVEEWLSEMGKAVVVGVGKRNGKSEKDWKNDQQLLDSFLNTQLGSARGNEDDIVYVRDRHYYVRLTRGKATIDGIVVCNRIKEARIAQVLNDGVVRVEPEMPRVRAVLGVSKIWVDSHAQRRGIASKLLDFARRNMIYGYVVPKGEVAFTAPTSNGARFAASYRACDDASILVYGTQDRDKPIV